MQCTTVTSLRLVSATPTSAVAPNASTRGACGGSIMTSDDERRAPRLSTAPRATNSPVRTPSRLRIGVDNPSVSVTHSRKDGPNNEDDYHQRTLGLWRARGRLQRHRERGRLQRHLNCYQTCFDAKYDTNVCETRCRDNANSDPSYMAKVDDCKACINDKDCAAATFTCASPCSGIVP